MEHMIDFKNLTQTQSQTLMGEEELENDDMRKLLTTLMERLESQLDPDFFQNDNDAQKKQKQQLNIVTQK